MPCGWLSSSKLIGWEEDSRCRAWGLVKGHMLHCFSIVPNDFLPSFQCCISMVVKSFSRSCQQRKRKRRINHLPSKPFIASPLNRRKIRQKLIFFGFPNVFPSLFFHRSHLVENSFIFFHLPLISLREFILSRI